MFSQLMIKNNETAIDRELVVVWNMWHMCLLMKSVYNIIIWAKQVQGCVWSDIPHGDGNWYRFLSLFDFRSYKRNSFMPSRIIWSMTPNCHSFIWFYGIILKGGSSTFWHKYSMHELSGISFQHLVKRFFFLKFPFSCVAQIHQQAWMTKYKNTIRETFSFYKFLM